MLRHHWVFPGSTRGCPQSSTQHWQTITQDDIIALVCALKTRYWSQVVQPWQMSRENADQIRSRTWLGAYCGITLRDASKWYQQARYTPRFLFVSTGLRTRIVVNQEDLLRWARNEGFFVPTPVKNLTDFRAQVALMESDDVAEDLKTYAFICACEYVVSAPEHCHH